MIYTVTLNPSIDYILDVPDLTIGEINRPTHEFLFPGGKGINVSLVLHQLGFASTPFGFRAGVIGDDIEQMIRDQGVEPNFTEVKQGNSRINVKLNNGKETQINGIGPAITADEIASFLEKFLSVQDQDTVILSGSQPSCIPGNLYAEIIRVLADRQVSIYLDTSGPVLRQCLPLRPFLIKPNQWELQEIFDAPAQTYEDCLALAKQAQAEGARNVLVSLGSEGALLICEDGKIWQKPAPPGAVKNTVGAGDSMVAGFVAGYQLFQGDMEKAFDLSLAAGSATSFCKGLASGDLIWNVFQRERSKS